MPPIRAHRAELFFEKYLTLTGTAGRADAPSPAWCGRGRLHTQLVATLLVGVAALARLTVLGLGGTVGRTIRRLRWTLDRGFTCVVG